MRLTDFWKQHPALLYAYTTLLGTSLALYKIGPIFIFLSLLLLIFPLFYTNPHRLRIFLAIVLGITSFAFTSNRYLFPEDNSVKTGIAEIEITSVRSTKTAFGQVWKYKAILKSFIHNGKSIAKDLPVTMSAPYDKTIPRPLADSIYQFPARLKKTEHGKYVLNPIKNTPWLTVQKAYNLVEWRSAAKNIVQKHIHDSIQDNHAKAFLSGIATGEFDDRLLSHELGRFGLQHLMAISGLHFSILSGLFTLALSLLFPRNITITLTIAVMSAYFLFLGISASVTRAWFAIVIGLTGFLIQRQGSGLNALGIGMLVMLLYDPLVMEEIGFQFSFGITAAILLWYSPCDALLQYFFKKRRLGDAVTMDTWDQHGYCVLYFLRQSLALTLAVNLAALPLTLYHFHNFPLMGFIYNLFFPFLMSLSLILLAVSCFFSLFFPWLGKLLHHLNESYTNFMLNFTFNLPKVFDTNLRVDEIPKEGIAIYLLVLFTLGIVLNRRFRYDFVSLWRS